MKYIPVIVAIVLCSCQNMMREKIKGNGVIKTESRTAGTFNSVHVSGAINVYVKQDSASSVKIEADENLLQYILIDNDNGELEIRQKDGVNLKGTKSIKVYVTNPVFKHFESSGACNIYSENKISNPEGISIHLSGASDVKMDLKTPRVNAELSGAGTVSLEGQTKDFKVDGSGATDIKCFGLMAENTDVELSGAGSAEVFASVSLIVHASGAANVRYKGNGAITKQSISGAGSLKKVE